MTKTRRIIYLDAFTSEPFCGNPCAVLPAADGLTDAQMQMIAMETNLSETAFVFRSTRAAVKVRYFMPHTEIPFAGHPTIATAMMLAQEGLLSMQGKERTVIDFEFNIGVLPVEIRQNAAGVPGKAIMTQQKPTFATVVEVERLAGCLGLSAADFNKATPPQVVSTGIPFLLAPTAGLEVLKRAQVNRPMFQTLLKEIGVDAAYLFCMEGFDSDTDAHGRLFPARAGSEDPFTGSAAGCMGAYIARYDLHPGRRFRVEQGHIMGRPGKGTIEIVTSADTITSVKVGGCAVKTLDGQIFIRN